MICPFTNQQCNENQCGVYNQYYKKCSFIFLDNLKDIVECLKLKKKK
jgi:CRISPR/Cas system CSM-associated protein Csm4 (group 5 of RAMP superfamily)